LRGQAGLGAKSLTYKDFTNCKRVGVLNAILPLLWSRGARRAD